MGWSCSAYAGDTLSALSAECVKQTGSQNVWERNGERYMFETSRTEHSTGAITGAVWRFVGEGRVRKVGSFKIDGSGRLVRAAGGLRELLSKEAL